MYLESNLSLRLSDLIGVSAPNLKRLVTLSAKTARTTEPRVAGSYKCLAIARTVSTGSETPHHNTTGSKLQKDEGLRKLA